MECGKKDNGFVMSSSRKDWAEIVFLPLRPLYSKELVR
jgi:hypothetical protein